ncbi:MAG: fatty acid desaturase [Woeseiaceae bacterium]
MLRDVSDVRSLVFLAAILGLETLVVINFNNVPTLLLPLLLFVLMVAVFIATLINHNHRHLPMFHAPWANRLLNGALTIAMGAPSTRLHAVHMLNHHKHYRTTDDWSHYSLAGSRRGLLRTLTYYKNATMRMGLNRKTLELTPEAGRELRI